MSQVLDFGTHRGMVAGKLFDFRLTVMATFLVTGYLALTVYVAIATSRGVRFLTSLGLRTEVMGGLEYAIGRLLAFILIVALIFLMPGTNETARLAGTARLSTDPELLASMAVQGKLPRCAIVVSVRQAYFHCAKALLRSRLWTGDYAQAKGTFPSISRMVGDQIGLSEEEKQTREKATEIAYRDGLWAPLP